MKIVAGLSEISAKTGSYETPYSEIVEFLAPRKLSGSDLAKLTRDCEIILERVKGNPKKIQQIINLGLSGDLLSMVALKKELKLREEDFENEGGGWLWLLILLILMLLPKCAK